MSIIDKAKEVLGMGDKPAAETETETKAPVTEAETDTAKAEPKPKKPAAPRKKLPNVSPEHLQDLREFVSDATKHRDIRADQARRIAKILKIVFPDI